MPSIPEDEWKRLLNSSDNPAEVIIGLLSYRAPEEITEQMDQDQYEGTL